jgi:hypothetical protein
MKREILYLEGLSEIKYTTKKVFVKHLINNVEGIKTTMKALESK